MDGIKRVAQACDACKLRKVKCNGQQRCQQCSHLDLRCVYPTKQKQRSSLKRGRLISQYKEQTSSAARASNVPLKLAPATGSQEASPPVIRAESVTSGLVSPVASTPDSVLPVSSSDNIWLKREPSSNYDASFFLDFLTDYRHNVFPFNPIIPEKEIRECISLMHAGRERCSFLYAYAAVTINLTKTGPMHTPEVSNQISYLIGKSAELRETFVSNSEITCRSIMTSMFLHNCLMSLRKYDLAFFYIREAITMILLMRIDDVAVMSKLDVHERARRQRLYWEAWIHERFLAIIDYRYVVLPPLSTGLPEFDSSLPPGLYEGFTQIIELFTLLDEQFMRNWLLMASDPASTDVTAAWIEQKHSELEDKDPASPVSLPSSHSTASLSDMQQADLIITRHWLRTLLWQMAMSKCLLSSNTQKEFMSLLFPVRVSSQLRHLITSFSRENIEVHGSGILQKLFEITDTIANVIIHVPAAPLENTTDRVEDFLFLIDFLFSFPRFASKLRQILMERLETLQQLFPYTGGPSEGSVSPGGALLPGGQQNMQPWASLAAAPMARGSGSLPWLTPDAAMPDGYGGRPEDRWKRTKRALSATSYSL